jgi:hypothetical protein
MMAVWAALQVHRALATLLGRIALMTDRRLRPAVISPLWAAGLALLIASPSRSLVASQPGDISPAVATIESMYVLEDAPLPLPPETPAASHDLGFRFGGISDLFRAETAADGTIFRVGVGGGQAFGGRAAEEIEHDVSFPWIWLRYIQCMEFVKPL